MKYFIYLIFWVSVTASGQTRVIYHKSHSGHKMTFHTAMNHNMFFTNTSNFGAAPVRRVQNAQLDTVVFLSGEKSVMITSEYCTLKDKRTDNITEKGSFWKAGKDTLVHHPLFSKKHALDSIKTVLKTEYHFKNDIDKVVFIGYDNGLKKTDPEKKNTVIVTPPKKQNKTPWFIGLALITIAVTLYQYLSRKKTHA